MGTSGLFGLRKGNVDKVSYCHMDGYPDYLGHEFIKLINKNSIEQLNTLFDNIKNIDTTKTPTKEEIEYCKENNFCDFSVSRQSEDDWYCLLRNTQAMDTWQEVINNEKEMYLNALNIEFIKDSLFCEYAYIFDLDTQLLEFYEGYQQQADPTNRYGTELNCSYYPCKKILEFNLEELKNIYQCIEDMNNGEKIKLEVEYFVSFALKDNTTLDIKNEKMILNYKINNFDDVKKTEKSLTEKYKKEITIISYKEMK